MKTKNKKPRVRRPKAHNPFWVVGKNGPQLKREVLPRLVRRIFAYCTGPGRDAFVALGRCHLRNCIYTWVKRGHAPTEGSLAEFSSWSGLSLEDLLEEESPLPEVEVFGDLPRLTPAQIGEIQRRKNAARRAIQEAAEAERERRHQQTLEARKKIAQLKEDIKKRAQEGRIKPRRPTPQPVREENKPYNFFAGIL